MHERVRRMILGAITGVIIAVAHDAFAAGLAGVHVGWRMAISGVAAGLIYAALDALSKRNTGKGHER